MRMRTVAALLLLLPGPNLAVAGLAVPVLDVAGAVLFGVVALSGLRRR